MLFPMKTIGMRELQTRLRDAVQDAQREPVVVLSHARPVAVIVGIEDRDLLAVIERANKLVPRGVKR